MRGSAGAGGGFRGWRARVALSVVPRRSDLCLAIHGANAACHGLHGAPGSFAATMSALSRARAEGQRVWVASWITRSNCRSLVALADVLVGHRVAGWAICWPRVGDATAPSLARLVPRLGIAVPHALRAVERARGRGLEVALVDVPSCALGPFAAHALRVGAGGVYPPVCEGCPSRAGCAGIEPWTLARLGGLELRQVPVVHGVDRSEEVAQGLAAAVIELGEIA